MPGPACVGRLIGPFENRELLGAALDHEPFKRITANEPTHFTPIFLKSCHGFFSNIAVSSRNPLLTLSRADPQH
jgi:hypothetical protein